MHESQWSEVGGLRMHARSAGSTGPVFVLVHGLGVSSRYMIPTLERLGRFGRAYAPDLPGFGRSEKPKRGFLGLRGLANALLAWMDEAEIERATLLGNSLGCQIVSDAVSRFPGRAEAIVLVGPTTDPEGATEAEQIRRWLASAPFDRPSLAVVVAFEYLAAGPVRVWQTFESGLRHRIELDLPRIPCPALVVRGEHDRIIPQRWGEEAAGLLPDGRLAVVPGTGHAVNYSAADALAELVRELVS